MDYSWLSSLVDPNNCEHISITVYASGIYQYLLVEDADASILYNQEGVFYCQNASNYDCIAAYNLTEIIAEWNCNVDSGNENQEETDPPNTSETSIFEKYDWLNTLVDQNNCANTAITVYASGIYQYLLVEEEDASILYNQEGVFYCQNASNYDCVAAYNLTEVVTEWHCSNLDEPISDSRFNTTNYGPKNFALYPNPTSNQLFIELPSDFTSAIHSIQLIDINGRILKNWETAQIKTKVDVSAYDAGMYFIKWQSNEVTQTERFIIKR